MSMLTKARGAANPADYQSHPFYIFAAGVAVGVAGTVAVFYFFIGENYTRTTLCRDVLERTEKVLSRSEYDELRKRAETPNVLNNRSVSDASRAATPECREPLGETLDRVLGSENWFVYPDDNRSQVGVSGFPAGSVIQSPLLEVHTDDGRFKSGESLKHVSGANVLLRCPWKFSDIPLWQLDSLQKWRRDQRAGRVSRKAVDGLFGNRDWQADPRFAFSATGELSKVLQLTFPVTSVDFDGRKYGVGAERTFPAHSKVRIWLAGTIEG